MLISFLFEYISKYEEKEKVVGASDMSNALAWRVQKEFQKWKGETWILPEFLHRTRDIYLTEIHLTNTEIFVDELIDRGGRGPNSLISNALEASKAAKEVELAERRMNMEMREENPEQKDRILKMKNTFANFGKKIQLANKESHLNIWEKKKMAKEALEKKLEDEGNAFLRKVLLEKKKRNRPKKIKKRVEVVKEPLLSPPTEPVKIEEKKEGELPTEVKVEEKKEEVKETIQETPMEAFQRKLNELKQEKEKEISEGQDILNKIDGKN